MRHSTSIRPALRVVGVTCAVAALLALSGCWVTSINGLDDGALFRADPDRTFEAGLDGSWVAPDKEDCTMKVQIKGYEQAYTLRESETGKGCSDSAKQSLYRGMLFRLDNHLFLDLSARSEDVCEMCRSEHDIFLLQLEEGSFSLTPIDSEWLKNALANMTITLPTLPDDTDTITASPKDLKAFCRQYADDPEVFNPTGAIVFTRP